MKVISICLVHIFFISLITVLLIIVVFYSVSFCHWCLWSYGSRLLWTYSSYWHCLHSMRSSMSHSRGLYLCNGCVSVCLSVCLSVRSIDRWSSVRRVCCWALRVQEISIDSGGQHSSTALSSKRGQCHVYSRRRRLISSNLLRIRICELAVLPPLLVFLLAASYNYTIVGTANCAKLYTLQCVGSLLPVE